MERGVLLAARFAFPPNSYGHCGKKTFIHALKRKNTCLLKAELKHFRAHFAYLKLIASANNLKPFDRRVVEAFWIGNELLDGVNPSSLRSFISRNPFPQNTARAKKLCKNLPKGILPHHSFHVLYVNFLSGRVGRSISNYDRCCITSGKILSYSKKTALVKRFAIKKEGGKLALGTKMEKIMLEKNCIRLLEKVKKGDLIAIHWGMAVKKIDAKEAARLEHYTQRNINAINP